MSDTTPPHKGATADGTDDETDSGLPFDAWQDAETEAVTDRLDELLARKNADRWEYETKNNYADIRAGIVSADLDAMCEDPEGRLEVHSISRGHVPLSLNVSTPEGHKIGALVNLTAEQAEAVAADLLEQASAARAEADGQQ